MGVGVGNQPHIDPTFGAPRCRLRLFRHDFIIAK